MKIKMINKIYILFIFIYLFIYLFSQILDLGLYSFIFRRSLKVLYLLPISLFGFNHL